MSKCIVNGKEYNIPDGCSINIVGDDVVINGTILDSGNRILIQGNIGPVTCDKSVNIEGTVNGYVNCKGSFNGGEVIGDVKAGGSVNCGNIEGNVSAGGSINADKIGGRVVM